MRIDPAAFPVRHATTGAPHLRDGMNMLRLNRYLILALLPASLFGLHNAGRQANRVLAERALTSAPGWRGTAIDALGVGYDSASAVACFVHGLLILAPILATALVTAELWRRLFARHGSDEAAAAAVVALLFALAVPPATAAWQVAVGMSFGVVVGKEIFGGTGKNFLHPALTALAFLYLTYPEVVRGPGAWTAVGGAGAAPPMALAATGGIEAVREAGITWADAFFGDVPGSIGAASTLAALFGAAVLSYARLISWRILAGTLAGLAATASAFEYFGPAGMPAASLPWYWHLNVGGFAFLSIFFATDPVTAAVTNPGRWIYGVLIGGSTVLIRVANPAQSEAVVLAILLGNVAAPVTDYGVLWLNIRRRRRRHG